MGKGFFDNKKLQQVFEQVWLNPGQALINLESLPTGSSAKALTPGTADAQLLKFMLHILLQRFEDLDLVQQQLKLHYQNTRQVNKTALLDMWCMYGFITIGNLNAADKIRVEFTNVYTPEQAPLAYACYYAFSCAYSDKNGYFEDFMRLAQEEEEHIAKYEPEHSWKQALLCIARLHRARAQSNYARTSQAMVTLQQVEADIDENGLCNLIHEAVLYSYAMHYENQGERTKSLALFKDIVAMASNRKYNNISKFGAIANLINIYGLRNRLLSKTDTEYIANRQEQLKWIKQADTLTKNSFTSSVSAFYQYTKAGFYWQENMLPEALQAIAKSILIFYRYSHVRFLAQAYTTAYKIYKTSAVSGVDYRMAYKAARCSEQVRMMSDRYYKQVLERRIATVETQFKIKEKELNEALLQQQINAMNKEVQLTTLSLHEKIQVLDEIKTYVNSLKKKELETRQLINTIARKIDSVKLTEEDKATLQQKISDTNQRLAKALTEKYPLLSPLEIRMCGLFQTGMTNKELSKLYGQGEKSYEQHRYRIKKKMNLTGADNLVKHLTLLNEGKQG